MNAVVELGQGTVQVPGERQAPIFVFLETLEFLDEVEFELNRYPGSEFKSDVLVCVGAAVTSLFLNPSNSRGLKTGLFKRSHIPKNSMVLRFLIQFWMT